MLWGAIAGRTRGAGWSGNPREIESLVAVAVGSVLSLAVGEAEGAESRPIAAVMVVAEAVRCSKVRLFDLCPGLMAWAVVQGDSQG